METGEVLAVNGQETDGLWLSKGEAAALLGVQTRQIERREAAGQLRKRMLPKEAGQTAARVVYSKADLLALKAGTPNDYRAPGREVSQKSDNAASTAIAPAALVTGGPWLEALGALLARVSPAPVVEPRPWLTLDEAADYSGLPASWLLKSAQAGYVGAIDLGGRPRGGRWRFRRGDLARIGA